MVDKIEITRVRNGWFVVEFFRDESGENTAKYIATDDKLLDVVAKGAGIEQKLKNQTITQEQFYKISTHLDIPTINWEEGLKAVLSALNIHVKEDINE